MYSRNTTAGQWRAHGRYIARETVTNDPRGAGFDGHSAELDPAAKLEGWQRAGDPRLWKLIVSPEFGDRLDLQKLTRDLMGVMEADLGTKFEWVAVLHLNTEHPHVHVALRGVRDDGTPLQLDRDYVRTGIRRHAETSCTHQLGFRTEIDAMAAERREISASRYTSLDRRIDRASRVNSHALGTDATSFVFEGTARPGRSETWRDRNVAARLAALEKMGLATSVRPGQWRVRRDFESVLRAMQKAGDRQKMLAAHGALLSDNRLLLAVCDWRKLRSVEGRVVLHGEDELGSASGRRYLLLEGTDARAHMIYYTPDLERARTSGNLRVNSFVRLSKQFEGGHPVVEVEDMGDANALLRNRRHFESRVGALAKRGIVPTEDGWGGWLGRYQSELLKAAIAAKQNALRRSGRGRSDR